MSRTPGERARRVLPLLYRRAVGDQRGDTAGGVGARDLPTGGAFFERDDLRFVAVLVNVFDTQRGFAFADLLRVGDGPALDGGVGVPEVFRKTGFGAFLSGLPQGGLQLAGVAGEIQIGRAHV